MSMMLAARIVTGAVVAVVSVMNPARSESRQSPQAPPVSAPPSAASPAGARGVERPLSVPAGLPGDRGTPRGPRVHTAPVRPVIALGAPTPQHYTAAAFPLRARLRPDALSGCVLPDDVPTWLRALRAGSSASLRGALQLEVGPGAFVLEQTLADWHLIGTRRREQRGHHRTAPGTNPRGRP